MTAPEALNMEAICHQYAAAPGKEQRNSEALALKFPITSI
jgi:hypothetical protein